MGEAERYGGWSSYAEFVNSQIADFREPPDREWNARGRERSFLARNGMRLTQADYPRTWVDDRDRLVIQLAQIDTRITLDEVPVMIQVNRGQLPNLPIQTRSARMAFFRVMNAYGAPVCERELELVDNFRLNHPVSASPDETLHRLDEMAVEVRDYANQVLANLDREHHQWDRNIP